VTLEELRRIRRDGVTAAELVDAKRHLKGSILLSLESTVSRMSAISRQEFYFGRQYTPDEVIAYIDAVTEDDVARLALMILDPETMSLTLIGDLADPGITVDGLRQAIV
jgi:predicted Zn-dependent peptidase